jgi:heme exporter protein D
MRAFFEMGGYGAYVWSAFGFTAIAMLGLLFQSLHLARKRTAELEELRSRTREARSAAGVRLRPVRPQTAAARGEGR